MQAPQSSTIQELIRSNQVLQEEIRERKIIEKEILEISRKEQRRFSLQLHDGLCQDLTGILMFTKVLVQKMEKSGHPECEELKKILGMLHQVTNQARKVARGSYPVELEGAPLMRSLKELTAHTRNLGIECRFHCPLPVMIEDANTTGHLYRIAQEGISNAVTHGKAKNIEVSLTRTQGNLTLSISDDGGGVLGNPSSPQGIGLHIMRYRARLMKAALQIGPNYPSGTVLRCILKLPEHS